MTTATSDFDPDPYPFTLVTEQTVRALEELTPKALNDYREHKRDYLAWAATKGKNPHRRRGYADTTLKQIATKTDQVFRWLWEDVGYYTLDFGPEDADDLMEDFCLYDYSDANLLTFVKVIKRYFKYQNFEKGRDYEWECSVKLSEKQQTEREYLRRDEFSPLYNAALDHNSVPHPNQVTPEERDRIKGHLAQRFEKPKDEINSDDFARANTYKIPSLIGVTLDTGLRPIEVSRATVSWVNLHDKTLDIPSDEATKSDNNWKCRLSDRSIRSLEMWLDEREQYENYDDSDALWLNRRGNPYNSKSLNYLLRQLLDSASINLKGRNLSWYSIRHGVASAWANEEGIPPAQEQLRHEKVETTMRYVHSSSEQRGEMANRLW